MAHVAKYAMGATGHMSKHYERGVGNDGETIRYNNQNIDISRSHENYNLGPMREISQVEYIQKRIAEVRCQNRADVKIMCSWVVTAPKDLPAYDYRSFFESTYDFLVKRYGGEKNVVSAYVHMDEITPHIHFAFIPVAPDRRRGGEKITAKEVLTRTDLQSFHPELENHIARQLGYVVGIQNEATRDGNKSVEELKRNTAIEKVTELQRTEKKAIESAKLALGEVERLQAKGNALEDKLESLENELDCLQDEIDNLTKERNILKKVVSDEYQKLNGSIVGRIEVIREETERRKLLSVLERFLKLPVIQPLWEQFKQQEREQQRTRNRNHRGYER